MPVLFLIQCRSNIASVYTPGEFLSAQPSPHEVMPRRILSVFTIGPPESPYIIWIMMYSKEKLERGHPGVSHGTAEIHTLAYSTSIFDLGINP